MKKILIFFLFLIPVFVFCQTNESTVRSNINSKLPGRGNRAEGLKSTDVRSVLNDLVNYTNYKKDSLESYINKKVPFVTPEMFGAVGDSLTDDTNAIKAARNASLHVIFTKKYLVTDTINMMERQVFTGTGSINLKFATAKLGGINANSFCTVEGLTINQISTAPSIVSGQDNVCILIGKYVFQTKKPKHVSIKNCVLNMYSIAPSNTISVIGSNNVEIQNCSLKNYSTAIAGLSIHWSMNTSTPSEGTIHPYNVSVKNCSFTDYGKTNNTITSGVIWIAAASNVLLENIKIIGAGSSAIYLFAGDYGYYYASDEAKKTQFRNISLKNIEATLLPKTGINIVGAAVLAPGIPVYDMDININSVFMKNDSSVNTSNGITLANVSGVNVSNTTIDSFYTGIYFQTNTKNSSVQHTKINNSGKTGIYINGTIEPEDIKVQNCVITNTGSLSLTAGAGIEIGNAFRPLITSTIFGLESGTDLTTFGIKIAPNTRTVGAILENNYIRNLKVGGVGYSVGNSSDTGLVYKMEGNRVNTGITFRGGSTAITIDRN